MSFLSLCDVLSFKALLCPLQWKLGVLTTGPPGKSLRAFLNSLFLSPVGLAQALLQAGLQEGTFQKDKPLFVSCLLIFYWQKQIMQLSPELILRTTHGHKHWEEWFIGSQLSIQVYDSSSLSFFLHLFFFFFFFFFSLVACRLLIP